LGRPALFWGWPELFGPVRAFGLDSLGWPAFFEPASTFGISLHFWGQSAVFGLAVLFWDGPPRRRRHFPRKPHGHR